MTQTRPRHHRLPRRDVHRLLGQLADDVRDQLATIVEEVTLARNSESTSVNESAKAAIIEAGGVVRQLNEEQRAVWVSTMKPVWEQFEADVGQENIDAAQAINAKH